MQALTRTLFLTTLVYPLVLLAPTDVRFAAVGVAAAGPIQAVISLAVLPAFMCSISDGNFIARDLSFMYAVSSAIPALLYHSVIPVLVYFDDVAVGLSNATWVEGWHELLGYHPANGSLPINGSLPPNGSLPRHDLLGYQALIGAGTLGFLIAAVWAWAANRILINRARSGYAGQLF